MASSVQATRLRKGMLIKLNNELYRVLELKHLTPGNKRGMVQSRLRNVRNLSLTDHKFRSDDSVERATLDEVEMQYMYNDGDSYYFMDTTSFEQIHMTSEALGDAVNYLKSESVIRVEFYEGTPVGVELPLTVDLTVEDTAPGIKGATASAQVKPARTETGLVVNVPPFVNNGDKIRVNTETGEYQSRA
jgi:elongation factor P